MNTGNGEKVLLSWSGGKDSALCLHEVRRSGSHDVEGLLTVLVEDTQRVSMQGIRRSLVRKQADSLGLPLFEVFIPKDADNERYEKELEKVLLSAKERGIRGVLFGDLFLEDIRNYRKEKMGLVDMGAYFPLWGKDTGELASYFVDEGFKGTLSCVDTEQMDASFAGRSFNKTFLKNLPAKIDPCGENGEFHTFVFDGPIFQTPVPYKKGQIFIRDDHFQFCDFTLN